MSKASLGAGVYSLLFCIYVWVIIALFLTENHFNPIKDAFDDFFPKLEEFLLQKKNVSHQEEKFNETDENVKKYVENIRAFCPSIMITALAISVVHAFSTILMIIGISVQKTHGLVLPYIVIQLFVIIILAYGNVLMTLTLSFMPEDATFSTWFWLPYLVILAFVNILLIIMKKIQSFLQLFVIIILTFINGVMTLPFMPEYAGFTSWFWLVFIALSNMFLIYMNEHNLCNFITIALFLAILPTLPIAKVISFQGIFQLPLPICLIPVWKDFVNDELEEKDVR